MNQQSNANIFLFVTDSYIAMILPLVIVIYLSDVIIAHNTTNQQLINTN